MAYQIYEFHLSCNPVQLGTGELVSGGFTGKVRGQGEIPPEVANAALIRDDAGSFQANNKFSIPDTHPPKDNKTALIARDLGNYCVLAVLNRIKDNEKREFVGYQFFWLSKHDLLNSFSQDYSQSIYLDDIDGIATLLDFWEYNERPTYRVDIDLNPLRFKYRNNICIKKDFIKKYSSRVDELLQKFKSERNLQVSDMEPDDIHCLALDATFRSDRQLAWAWNVRKVGAQDFTVIYYADTNRLQYSPPQQKPTFTEQVRNALPPSGSRSNQQNAGYSHGQPSEQQQNNDIANDIRRCLIDISNTNIITSENIIRLLDYYRKYEENITDCYYEQQINNFINNITANPQANAIRHVALLVAIAPEKEQELAEGLKALNSSSKQVAIKFLDDLGVRLDNLKKQVNTNSAYDPYFHINVINLNQKLERSIPKINEERVPSFFGLFFGSSSRPSNQKSHKKQTPIPLPANSNNQHGRKRDLSPLYAGLAFCLIVVIIVFAFNKNKLFTGNLNIRKNPPDPAPANTNQQSAQQQQQPNTNSSPINKNILQEYAKLEAVEMAFPEVKELAEASKKIRKEQLIPSLQKLVTQLQEKNPDTNDPIYKELQSILPKYDPNKLRMFTLGEASTEVSIIQKALHRGDYYQTINFGSDPFDYSKFDLTTQETIKRWLGKDPVTDSRPLTPNNWKKGLQNINNKFILDERVERIINYLLITLQSGEQSGEKYSKFQKTVNDCKSQAKKADQPLIFDSCMEKTLSKGK